MYTYSISGPHLAQYVEIMLLDDVLNLITMWLCTLTDQIYTYTCTCVASAQDIAVYGNILSQQSA